MIPGDFLLLLRFGEDEPQLYWARSFDQAQHRGNEVIARRGRSPTLGLIFEKNSCPARGKLDVIARYSFGQHGRSGLWI